MDLLFEDCLTDDWENKNPKQLAKEVIQEFKDKYLEFIQVMNRQNKIKNLPKPPQRSEATKTKRQDYREANKEI